MNIRNWMHQSEHSRTSLLSLLVVVSILLALLIIPSWQKSQNDLITAEITLTNSLVTHLNELEVSLQEMRAAARGYIITENALFSAQFEQASERQRTSLDLLIQDVNASHDNPDIQLVAELERQIDEWRTNRLAAQISMVERGERDAAERDFLLGVSQQSYEKIRTLIGDLRSKTKIARRDQMMMATTLSNQSAIMNQVLVVFALIGVGIVVVGFNRISAVVEAQEQSEKAAQRLSSELATQLEHVNIQNARLALAQQLTVKSTVNPHDASRIQHLLDVLRQELALAGVKLRVGAPPAHSSYISVDSLHHAYLGHLQDDAESWTQDADLMWLRAYQLMLHHLPLTVGNRIVGSLHVIASPSFVFDPLIMQQFTLLLENFDLFAQIAQERQRLATVINTVPIGLMLIDEHGSVLVTNQKALELLPESQVGASMHNVLPMHQFYVSGGRTVTVAQLPIMHALAGDAVQPTEIMHEVGDQRIPVRHDVVMIHIDAYHNAYVMILEDMRTQYELERLKSDFVSMISHELRTPLAAIVGATSMLLTTNVQGRDQAQDTIKLINTQGQRLQKLIDDVLNVARIDRDGVRLQRERIDPQLIIRRLVERQRPWAALTRIQTQTELPDVYVDVLRIEQILENLLDNAVKYAPNSEIDVILRYDPIQKAVLIAVRDYGVPLDEHQRRRVFERFYQAHHETSGGVGLGLAICKYFVEAHGGDISMDAAQNPPGTVVTFSLPLTDQLETISIVKHGVAIRVLVVDDDVSVQRTLQQMLQELEYSVVVAGSVREAYERLDRMYFDLMIIDVMLPDQSGLDFVRDIRTWLTIPIMMVTARNSEKDVVAGLRAGVDDYMIKPFSYDEIALRVRNLLRRQHERILEEPSLMVGSVQLLLNSRQVKVRDELLDLTPIEHRLFVVFVRHLGQILPHEHLLQAVWGDRYEQENQYLWVHISHLRRKLTNAMVEELYIENVRGVGYRMMLNDSPPAHM